ncbi:hypothetical protein D9Q98_004795 [Chlorella vulgaris]|uniref:RNA polymerase II-associated factor 1 n=1 Tax=Chlorella vulgaris TaxID=3077 RepID=A0A9D4TQL5_CHLVU|nr:hypothetical protein D9Q98_004795 [Chlorella vulgaris]
MAQRKEEKRKPEWDVSIPREPSRLHRDTAFLCNIRFRNDLPEIPCDPKLLLPPYDAKAIAAFKLTELEKDLQKDLLFDADLGIPIHPWNIEQYSVSDVPVPLHPDDAALLASDEETEPQKNRLRGDAAEVSWLLRTKYIAAEAGLKRGGGGGASGGAAARRAAAAAAAPLQGAGGQEDEAGLREERVRQIEAQFAAAKLPLVHGKDPSLVPQEIMPVFPDSFLAGSSCVLATFDNDPLADVEHLQRLPAEQRARVPQAMQLKSFKPLSGPQFVALLVPKHMPEPGDDPLSAAGGIPGELLARQYKWVREYQPQPRLDEKSTTYLFRFAEDGTVQFHDLNTRLELRKRKRQAVAADDDTPQFDQPEMVVVRNPETGHYAERQEDEAAEEAAAGPDSQFNDEEGSPDQQQQRQQQRQQGGGGSGSDADMADGEAAGQQRGGEGMEDDGDEGGGGGYQGGRSNAALRDAFGDDDDDF